MIMMGAVFTLFIPLFLAIFAFFLAMIGFVIAMWLFGLSMGFVLLSNEKKLRQDFAYITRYPKPNFWIQFLGKSLIVFNSIIFITTVLSFFLVDPTLLIFLTVLFVLLSYLLLAFGGLSFIKLAKTVFPGTHLAIKISSLVLGILSVALGVISFLTPILFVAFFAAIGS